MVKICIFIRPEQGLTAAAPVVDPETGNLIAVVAIDYTMDDLSSVLTDSVGNESEWYAWIFEASQSEPYVVASSDGYVLVDADSIDGCIQLADENQQIPTLATDHNNSIIQIMSKEIVNVYGIPYVSNLTITDQEPQIYEFPLIYLY